MSIDKHRGERVYGFQRTLVKRSRPDVVESQLNSLSHLNRSAVLRWCAETASESRLAPESLVAVVRTFSAENDRQAASTAFECLVRRVSGWVDRKVRSWGFSGDEAEEAIRDGIAILWQYVADCTQKEELWECNFTTCFRLRIVTALADRAKRKVPTTSLTMVDNDGDEQGHVLEILDTESAESFSIVECKQIVETLSHLNPSVAQVVYLRMEGLQVKEIAERFGVTTRTIANWMASAREVVSDVASREATK